jgi:D-arabinose 1-dehydrogenase-like Zn-dependent alcohol dehydrogenase
MNVGVVGLGGLGHMVVKWGKAFGCKVGRGATVPDNPLALWWGVTAAVAAVNAAPLSAAAA